MHADTDVAESLTKLAAHYGPFLFAILFTLIIPVRAFQSFRDCAAKYPQPTDSERLLLNESELYFRSTWIAGFVLIAFSVGWWLYQNWDSLKAHDKNYWIKYEGDISVSGSDILQSQRSTENCIWKVYDPYDLHYHVIVLTHPPGARPIPIPLVWASSQQQQGYGGQRFLFQFDPSKTQYALKRTNAGLQIVAGN